MESAADLGADGRESRGLTKVNAMNLDRVRLEANFGYWQRELRCEDIALDGSELSFAMLTTTTFAYEKRWGDGAKERRYPYREILFVENALLSDRQRRDLGRYAANEPSRSMDKARAVGLDAFVFAYLGIHDAYYAAAPDLAMPAFGVFLRRGGLEDFPSCNATRRDLASPEIQWPPDGEFLLPGGGRGIAHYQSLTDPRHQGDFWHYWGSVKYWSDLDYPSRHWEWKVEFHYRDRVDVRDFAAILWPYERRGIRGGMSYSWTNGEASRFRDEHPECAVVLYQWVPQEPTLSFARASYAVAKYHSLHGRYPSDAQVAWETVRDAT